MTLEWDKEIKDDNNFCAAHVADTMGGKSPGDTFETLFNFPIQKMIITICQKEK